LINNNEYIFYPINNNEINNYYNKKRIYFIGIIMIKYKIIAPK